MSEGVISMASKYGDTLRKRNEEQKRLAAAVTGETPAQTPAPDPEPRPEPKPKSKPEQKTKRKPGRPKTKTENTKTVNIAVPVSVLEKIEKAKAKYNGNLTEYVNHCIAADLDAHFDEYETIYNMINNK